MLKRSKAEARRSLLLCLFVLGLVTAIIVVPYQYGTKAAGGKRQELIQRTVSTEDGFPNYDIREDESRGVDLIVGYRQTSGKDASAVANVRAGFVRGETDLKARIPTLKIEYNSDIHIPEVIGPDATQGRAFLTTATRPAGQKHADVLINFLKQNNALVGATDRQIDGLNVFADYTNPDGNLSWVELEQFIHGVPVFRGGIKAGFTKQGELIRVINNLAPGLNYDSISNDFGDPVEAVRYAAPFANYELKNTDIVPNPEKSSNEKVRFGAGGDWDITAERMYFPTEPGVAVPAWRVLIWKPVNAFYIIVDAKTGVMLWRKNLAADQTQAATYNIYGNSNSMIDVAQNPQPLRPSPISPALGTQGDPIARVDRTLIGNEGVLSFNNLGWMTDGANGTNGWTDGNNIQAGLDIDGTNGVDATQVGTNRVLSFAYNPPPGMPAPPDSLTTANSRSGASTQLFYVGNRYHDEVYKLGFTEAARNFQNDNFGRGGNAADRVSGEVQDSSGTNNANFASGSDGTRGRCQMYRFTNTTNNRDGDLDAEIVIHEFTHGLSNRLIGNNSGLGTTRAGGMGEGWSDFYALSLLSEPTHPLSAAYSSGGYATYQLPALPVGVDNTYYGIRRYPYAIKAFTGGPGNLPHNPLTAIDATTGCSISGGAFPPSAWLGTGNCAEVHNIGEVWVSMLWEVRGQFIARLGGAAGNQRFLQIVTDAMKLSGVNPTFQTMRDSILTAANTLPLAPEASADVADVWTGMALRGMGTGATDNGTTVVESFVAPGAISVDPFSVSDSTGDNDGFPEPGEPVLLSIAVNNTTGATINNVQVNVSGGAAVNYGSIANGQTVTNNIPYTVPANAVCGSFQNVSINVVNPTGTNTTVRNFRLGVPSVAPVTFTNSAAITIPAGAPTTTNGASTPYPSTIAVAGLSGNKILKVKFNQLSHTAPNNIDMLLVGPGGQKMEIVSDQGGTNPASNVDLTLSDGSLNAIPATMVTGEFKPTADAGQDVFAAPAPGPVYLLAAPGGSATLASAFGSDGSALNGNWNLYIVDDTATNVGSIAGGWSLIFETGDFTCSFGGGPSPTPTNTPANTPTNTPANTPTNTPTRTSTNTPTNTPTSAPSATPTATGTPPVTAALPNVSASPGSLITVPITVGDTTGRGIISYDLQITFNPAIVQPASPAFDATGTLSSAMSVTPNTNNPGHFIVSAFQAQNLAGAGTLLNLKFNVVGTAGQSTALAFEDYTDPGTQFHPGFAWNEGDPPAFTTNGNVTVSGGATATNTPTNTPTNAPTATATATSTPQCTPAGWQAGPAQPPGRYAIQGVLGTDNMLYIAGGQSADATPVVSSQVSRYNPTTNTWSNVAPLPVALGQASTGAANGKIFVAGGFIGGTSVTNALRIYDIATNTWSSGANMPTAGVEAAASAVVNGKFYVMGGDDFTNGVNTTFIYDIAANTWSTGAPILDARTNTYGTAINGLIYVYGGVNIVSGSFVTTDTLLRYDPVANSWTSLGSAGTSGARGNYGAVSPLGAGQLLITDGANASGVSTNATHIFTISGGTFSAGPAMIGSRAGHAQATLPDGRVIVVDGFDTASTTTSNVELLSSGCPTGTPTNTPTMTPTNTPTSAPSATPTNTMTAAATATATGTPPVTVALPNVSAAPGALITVPVTVGDTTGRGIISYDFQVTFNPAILQPATPEFDSTGTLSSTMSITPNANNPGHLIISAFQAQNLVGAGTLLNLKFNVVGTAGQSTALTFEDYTDPGQIFHPGFAWNEGDPPAFTTNGSVTVSGATPTGSPSATGTSTATPTASPTVTPPVAVILPNVTAAQGSLITIPVTVSDTTGRGIISYDFNIDYNPAVLTPASPAFDQTGTLSSTMSITPNTNNAGHFIISAFQATELVGAGTLLNLKFNVVGTSGTSTALTFADYTDPSQIFHPGFQFNEGIPPASTTNGSVTVSGATPTATATPAFTSIQFSSATYLEDESQTAAITITRTGNLSGTDTVTFSTANGTAVGGVACTTGIDYVIVSGQSVTFNPTDTTKTVNVTLCGDGTQESDETVNLSLTGANLGSPSTAVLTINDTATKYENQANIAINGSAPANPYPSTITVSGGPSIIGSMRITLYDLSINVPDTAAYLLVGPGGQKFILMAGAGGLTPGGPVTLNFTDTAGQVVPDNGPLATTDYEPTSWGAVSTFPAPAPAGPYNEPGSTVGGTGTQTLNGNFAGTNANGVWSLYITDAGTNAAGGPIGNVAGGWGLEFAASTAASASVSGRVMTSDGAGIRNAKVVITGNSLSEPRIATTGSFGYFSFEGLQTGETYVVTVNSQRYTFSMPSRVISLVDNIADMNFIADPME